MTFVTITIRSRSPWRTRTSSPGRITCAGLTRTPLTLTWPPLHAVDAADRDLANRTDQIQLSTRAACAVSDRAAGSRATAGSAAGSCSSATR